MKNNRSDRPKTVTDYVKHAKRGSTEGVYAEAAEHLEAGELGRLVQQLRGVDPTFRLGRKRRNRLIVSMIEAKVPNRRIVRQLDVSRQTVWRTTRELVEVENRGCKPALQSGIDVTKNGYRPNGSNPAEMQHAALHFDGTSGLEDDRPLRWLLGLDTLPLEASADVLRPLGLEHLTWSGGTVRRSDVFAGLRALSADSSAVSRLRQDPLGRDPEGAIHEG